MDLKFKPGDRVSWCGKEGRVITILGYPHDLALQVEFGPNEIKLFTVDGKLRDEYLVPSLIKIVPKPENEEEGDTK